MSWFECVPNFSEGRDEDKIARLVAAGEASAGVTVLDSEQNGDHNRCVITLVGEGPALVDAVVRMMKVATELIDLTTHQGEHPRMGATDVVPFVPLGDATTAQAVELAVVLGTRVWEELQIPVYLYGDAARVLERQDLAKVRAGQFEGIRDTIATDPARRPDIGEPRVHPTAGVVAIGARPLLIAYNAYLSTPDVAVAKRVASAVRSRDGGSGRGQGPRLRHSGTPPGAGLDEPDRLQADPDPPRRRGGAKGGGAFRRGNRRDRGCRSRARRRPLRCRRVLLAAQQL